MTRDGKMLNRWITSHLKEVAPGIWLPLKTRQERFAAKPPAELNGQPVLIDEIKVQSVEINQVQDDRFDMVPKQGDVIEDLRGRF